MTTASICSAPYPLPEQPDFDAWAAQLDALYLRISPHFVRLEPRRRALAYLKGLLGNSLRKNGWHLAEQAGELTPDGMQRLLNAAHWDADTVRDELRSYVVEHLGREDAIAILDETGFLKQGQRSVGVQRQYSGTAGRVENCQVAVFLGYATAQGFNFIDRELYLPKEWTEDPARCSEAGVPDGVRFATKPQLARAMIARAHKARVPLKWVVADAVYGNDRRLRLWLEEQSQSYVLSVACSERVWLDGEGGPTQVKAEQVVAAAQGDWCRLSCGAGNKGPREYDWQWVRLLLPTAEGWGRWLLVRRSVSKVEELAYYMVFAPEATRFEQVVRVVGARWHIEVGFELTKGELGLDQYQVRRWEAWYRHVTLVLLAQACLSVVRLQAVTAEAQKGGPSSTG